MHNTLTQTEPLIKLTEIITDVGKESLPLVNISGHKNDPNKAVSENIKQLTAEKRQFNRTRRALLSDRQYKNRRIEFIHTRSKYKRTKYYLKNLNKENRIAKLDEMESKDHKNVFEDSKTPDKQKGCSNKHLTTKLG